MASSIWAVARQAPAEKGARHNLAIGPGPVAVEVAGEFMDQP
jgi:hypothetical protein